LESVSADTGENVPKTKTGTREWAEKTVNIQRGCSNGCRYCYAAANALRFKQVADRDEWLIEKINPEQVEKYRGKSKGRIMFPSSHDITIGNIRACLTVLKKLAEAGNELLIVTKPRLDCVRSLLAILEPFKKKIVLRFTIGAMDNEVLSFWEPGAPSYEERKKCLVYAHREGWATSVSIEPMLDADSIGALVADIKSYVTETIWIGKMNQAKLRFRTHNKTDRAMLAGIEQSQADEKILKIYAALKKNKKVRWKDSIKKVVGLPEE
jgi:DNA repair photolyase